eukprot:a969_33.p1 GENE.a969_33~~a969_33.p1  ORF type:complete len:330 (-),score=123.05 a969_33:258-1217(-)
MASRGTKRKTDGEGSPAPKRAKTGSAKAGDVVPIANVHIDEMTAPDYLYHLGLDTTMDVKAMFGDTKFVCMGGSALRVESIAKQLVPALGMHPPAGLGLVPIGKTERYFMYKVGPVVCVNHGMGMPSMSILLHEITKLLHHAEARDVTYIRIGTSGGLGLEPGTVVIASAAVNGACEQRYDLDILGEHRSFETPFDAELAQALYECRGEHKAVIGITMGTNCFYEGQGRLDGALCDYTNDDKMAFLRRIHDKGVRNIEMEASYLAAFTHRLGIRAAVVCCTLLNRLDGDQVTSTHDQLSAFSQHAVDVVIAYIVKTLAA